MSGWANAGLEITKKKRDSLAIFTTRINTFTLFTLEKLVGVRPPSERGGGLKLPGPRFRQPCCTHSKKVAVSIISGWDFVFNMTYYQT